MEPLIEENYLNEYSVNHIKQLTNILNFHQAFWCFNQGNYIAIYLIKKFRHIAFKIWNETKILLLQILINL